MQHCLCSKWIPAGASPWRHRWRHWDPEGLSKEKQIRRVPHIIRHSLQKQVDTHPLDVNPDPKFSLEEELISVKFTTFKLC